MNNYTARKAGEITRYHTHQCIKPQNVATHVWNVMRIYCERYGAPRSDVWLYIMHHDTGEIKTGDVPFLTKRKHPQLKKILDEAEQDAVEELGITVPVLTPEEYDRVKICDLQEMGEYAETELAMGNRFMQEVVVNINRALEKYQ